MRPIDADALKDKLQQHHDFWVMAWGGFSKMPISDKKRVDEITNCIAEVINAPTIDALSEWILCSERLPDDIRPVIVTWKNNDPASYYQYIVGKHFIGTAHYHRGKWYWYSSVTEDLLAEYGECEMEEFDEAIEAVAWMPLPKPYEEVKENE